MQSKPFRIPMGCWALLLCTLVVFSFQGHSLPKSCSDLLAKTKSIATSSAENAKQYYSEAKRTYGLRLLFIKSPSQSNSQFFEKMPQPDHTSKRSWGRYLSALLNFVPQKLGYWVTLESDVKLTPIRGLWNLLIDRPIGYFSKMITGNQYQSSALLSFAVATGMSVYAMSEIDAIDQSSQQSHVVASVEQNRESYEYIVDVDYRFADIKAAHEKGLISDEDLSLIAFVRLDSFRQYESYISLNENDLSLETEMPLLETSLFSYLKPIIQSGVTEINGFQVPESSKGPLSEKQILDLFYFTHLRYLEYQFIEDVFIFEKYDLQTSQAPEKYLKLQKAYSESEFVQKLLESGLPKHKIVYYLMEWAHWKNLFANWSTLEISRLKKGEGGIMTSDPLTLSDIEAEMLLEVTSVQ